MIPGKAGRGVCVCVCVCARAQLCPTLCDPIDCSLPGFSVHGMFQARILERVDTSFSWGSSWHRDQTHISGISCIGQWVLYHWATREAEKADTMSQTKIAGADDSHIPSKLPTMSMQSIQTFSSQSLHLPGKDVPGFRILLCLCPWQIGNAWELSRPSFTIYSLFGKADSGHFCYVNHF